MATRRVLGALVLALVAGSLVGCSSSEPAPKPPLPESTARAIGLLDHILVDRLQPGVVVVDVERLRTLLGGGTTDLDAAIRGTDQTAKHFAELMHVGLPQLETAGEWPAGKAALDLKAITGVAGNGKSGGSLLTVIATTQPFDDLAQKLVAAGYERQGDVLVAGQTVEAPGGARVVAGGPGVVVLTGSTPAAEKALASTSGVTGPLSPVRDIVTWANAPVVTVSANAPTAMWMAPCLEVVAYTDDVVDRRERIIFTTDSPDADRVSNEARLGEVEPVIEDRHVTIPLTYDDKGSSANLVTATGLPDGKDLYDCG